MTSNLGAVWSLVTHRATEGTWDSEPLDARIFSAWGLATLEAAVPPGAHVTMASRSGNTAKPEKTWSDWVDADAKGKEFALKSPAARYLQVRIKLGAGDAAHGPAVSRLSVYYTQRNLPPIFGRLTVHEPGSGLQKVTQPEPPMIGTLDSMVSSSSRRDPMDAARRQRVQVVNQPGMRSASWTVGDYNFDPLTFDVYLRAEGEKTWKMLEEKSSDVFYTFDTRSFPDGYYRLKVVATDASGNPPGKGLSAGIESAAFAVDNTPPAIAIHNAATANDGVLTVKFTVTDALTPIAEVEVSANGRDWFPAQPDRAQVGARSQDFTVRLPGTKSAFIRARDEAGNLGAARAMGR